MIKAFIGHLFTNQIPLIIRLDVEFLSILLRLLNLIEVYIFLKRFEIKMAEENWEPNVEPFFFLNERMTYFGEN